METYVAENGQTCHRSCGWETLYFGNSNRNPFSREVKTSPRHILDMAFTCYYMLIWYEELQQDPRLLQYVTAFADRLLQLQSSDGFFPAWLDADDAPMGILDDSPESALPAAVLFKLARLTNKKPYQQAAERALQAIAEHIVPEGRWEDFETYWSCSVLFDDHVGKKLERNAMYKQCNFSMYFTALAYLEAYHTTGDPAHLQAGARVLDEMLMTQSSYQPTNLPIPVIGGFGVMNGDAELNDLRSSLFAPLILEYGKLLHHPEYTERGHAALKASFSLMYCPENPASKSQWEAKWPFFGEADYGFMMENYGHLGEAGEGGLGIGEFTIFDWGNGAAAEAYERILDLQSFS